MKLADILALTKAGYSISEIKHLEQRDSVIELVTNGVARDDVKEYLELMADSAEAEPENTQTDPETDYKALYESEVSKRQQEATQAPSQDEPEPTIEDIISKLIE